MIKNQEIFENALTQARSCDSYLTEKEIEFRGKNDEEAKFLVNWHKKFTLSFACLTLLIECSTLLMDYLTLLFVSFTLIIVGFAFFPSILNKTAERI